jgi:hypothetical protein
MDTVRQRIDQLTPSVPTSMTRTDIVTWFMINYLAGVRDAIANPQGMIPSDEPDRQAVVERFTENIRQLAETTSFR